MRNDGIDAGSAILMCGMIGSVIGVTVWGSAQAVQNPPKSAPAAPSVTVVSGGVTYSCAPEKMP